jgi:hypothetical protein
MLGQGIAAYRVCRIKLVLHKRRPTAGPEGQSVSITTEMIIKNNRMIVKTARLGNARVVRRLSLKLAGLKLPPETRLGTVTIVGSLMMSRRDVISARFGMIKAILALPLVSGYARCASP